MNVSPHDMHSGKTFESMDYGYTARAFAQYYSYLASASLHIQCIAVMATVKAITLAFYLSYNQQHAMYTIILSEKSSHYSSRYYTIQGLQLHHPMHPF